MFCPNCGHENDDNAYKCVNCSGLMHPAGPEPRPAVKPPPNYLVYAILTTLFCCLPFGIVAIVYAAQVDSKAIAGNMAEAQANSKNAKTWCWVAFGCGAAVWLIYIGIFFMGMMAAIVEGQ